MEEKETKFDIVILSSPMVKYSPFSFGTAFSNSVFARRKGLKNTEKFRGIF